MSKNGLPYYRRFPRDFIEGTIGMPFEVKAGYGLLLDLIYMQGGNLPDDARYISGLLGVSVRKWNAIRSELIERGKLAAIGGFLSNYRAIIELESLGKFQDKQSENRSNPNKTKDLQSPNANHTEPYTEPIEKPVGFSARGARKKPRGWIDRKTPQDALNNVIQRIRENEQQRAGEGIDGDNGDVLQLSAIGRSGA